MLTLRPDLEAMLPTKDQMDAMGIKGPFVVEQYQEVQRYRGHAFNVDIIRVTCDGDGLEAPLDHQEARIFENWLDYELATVARIVPRLCSRIKTKDLTEAQWVSIFGDSDIPQSDFSALD